MKKWNYYNDNNPYVAQWARNLIKAGLAPDGVVDERSIKEVAADDIKEFVQCHFFCGILGWSYALRLAGWPEDREVWTGSCPCQPFACSGKRKSYADERHLWPAFYSLIDQCRPTTLFGEQVASKDGREWLSAVRTDLENTGYAVGAANLPAVGFGAPHERQRHFFVANANSVQQRQEDEGRKSCNEKMETNRIIADAHTPRSTNGQVVARIREAEISLNRCSFVEKWQSWNGGFGGFGRLDDGVSPRVAKSVVGGFGNAIVPQAAQAFIEAFMECSP